MIGINEKAKKLLELFFTFLKIGAFTFGGGYAMIPLIQSEIADTKGWISTEDILDVVAIAESTPGPFAVNTATYIGRQAGGIASAVCATLGVVLPLFVIILIIAGCYESFKNSRIVKGAMYGLRPAVIGLIAAAVVSVGKTAFFGSGFEFNGSLLCSFGILAITSYLAFGKKVHPIMIILISAVLGIAAGYIIN